MSDTAGLDWLQPHRGRRPQLRWQFRPDAPLAQAVLARESGHTFVIDQVGHLYRVDRRGQLAGINRIREPLSQLVWSDTGTLGAAVAGGEHLMVFDESLQVLWQTDAPEPIVGLAVDPFGHYLAAALEDRTTIVLSRHRKKIATIESVRPLAHVAFLADEPILIGAAEHGLLAGYSLGGERLWTEKVLSGVGSLAVAASGARIVLANFSHGVTVHDEVGDSIGAMTVEGTAVAAAADIHCNRLLIATLEQTLYWVDTDGDVLWAGPVPEVPESLAVDPLGEFIQPALADEGVLRLAWD